jgi:hypothetical protein
MEGRMPAGDPLQHSRRTSKTNFCRKRGAKVAITLAPCPQIFPSVRQYESTRTPKLTRDLVSRITRRGLAWEQTSRFRSTGSKMVRAWSNPESLPLLAMGEAMDCLLRTLSISECGLAQMNKSDKACSIMEWNDDRQTSYLEIKELLLNADI